MEAGSHYRNERGAEYLAYQRKIGELGARLNRWKFLPHLTGDQVVADFGCGIGALLQCLPAKERVGIEPNPLARKEAVGKGIRAVSSPKELADASVDIVISNHALEHTTNPHGELTELRRVLKDGGRLVLWIPLDDWRTQRDWRADDPNHHLYAWTPLLISNLVTEAGLAVDECAVVRHAWPLKAALFSRLPGFDLLARLYSVLARRRQLMVVATRSETTTR